MEKDREWYAFGVRRTFALCREEPDRESLMAQYRRWEAAWVEVLRSLQEADRETAENYIASVISLEHQKARVAYRLGKQVGSGQVTPEENETAPWASQ